MLALKYIIVAEPISLSVAVRVYPFSCLCASIPWGIGAWQMN